MRTLKINSETWLWKRGHTFVVIREERGNVKFVVRIEEIGEMSLCSYCKDEKCDDSGLVVAPRHIRAFLESKR